MTYLYLILFVLLLFYPLNTTFLHLYSLSFTFHPLILIISFYPPFFTLLPLERERYSASSSLSRGLYSKSEYIILPPPFSPITDFNFTFFFFRRVPLWGARHRSPLVLVAWVLKVKSPFHFYRPPRQQVHSSFLYTGV